MPGLAGRRAAGLWGGARADRAGDEGACAEWACGGEAAGASCGSASSHGLLRLQQCGGGGCACPAEAWGAEGAHCGLGHSPRERHPAHLRLGPFGPLLLRPPLRARHLLPRLPQPVVPRRGCLRVGDGVRGCGHRCRGGNLGQRWMEHARSGHTPGRRRIPRRVGRASSSHRLRVQPRPGLDRGRLRRGRRRSPRRLPRQPGRLFLDDTPADAAGGRAGGGGSGGRIFAGGDRSLGRGVHGGTGRSG
mmetsp:Transcript_8515/g.28031  ORF Transcript_8515/g.28031 Transcript_8515/m.28031 type:complete len:247 (+) Transcript_8515:350-1090(+)